jgi:hypothetical protein
MSDLRDQIAVLRAQGVPAEEAIEVAHLVPDHAVDAFLKAQSEKAQASAAAIYAASPEGQEQAALVFEAEAEAQALRAHRARVSLVAEGEITPAMADGLTDEQALHAAGWDGAVTEASLARDWSKLTEAERAKGCRELGFSVAAFENFGLRAS